MKDTSQILNKLRSLMLEETTSLSAYIVPSDDAHQSEYIASRDERRAFISGFNGSSGTAVVTTTKALLWTDGRYYQQASKQLDNNWILMKDGLPNTPTIGSWLSKNLPRASFVGVDPKLLSFRLWKPIQKELAKTECSLVAVEQNLIDIVWSDERPKIDLKPILCLDLMFCGVKIQEKWENVKIQMKEKNVGVLVVCALDEIAWFLNLRGSDIVYNPVFFSYLIITHNEIILFIEPDRLPSAFEKHKSNNNVEITVYDYNCIGERLSNISKTTADKIWIAPTSSYYLTSLIPKGKRHQEITPIAVNKSIKNEVEIKGFINSHVRDGVALCQYFAWLEHQIENGEVVEEISGATKLEELRSKQIYFKGLSFGTISASGPNGSVIHYHPCKETNRQITRSEIYLCDSGAQYLDGTTDVTRTFHFGEPTDFQKETYTRVLKGQLFFGSMVFPRKIKGQVLDTIARKSLWDVGLDYGHGTGHGVGHFLNVHEGPMGVGIRLMPDDQGLQENMFISNEPGYYQDGDFGIRIEDIVQVVPASAKYDFAGRGALTFKTITMCPKQTKMIKNELLTENEVKMLNTYHENVWDVISPILKENGDEFTLEWLQIATAPL